MFAIKQYIHNNFIVYNGKEIEDCSLVEWEHPQSNSSLGDSLCRAGQRYQDQTGFASCFEDLDSYKDTSLYVK